jgi:branched-subunit amino acid ABC-type transport system permease component
MGLFFKIFFTSGGGDTLPPAGTTTAGVPFAPSVLLAALGVAVIGLGLEHFVIRRFYDRPFETLRNAEERRGFSIWLCRVASRN